MIALGFVFKHQDWITNSVKDISSEFDDEHTEQILFYDLFQDIGEGIHNKNYVIFISNILYSSIIFFQNPNHML